MQHVAHRTSDEVAQLQRRVQELERVLRKVEWWSQQRCPCNNDQPNPCPLCGASVENLEPCKAAENTFPRDLLAEIRALAGKEEG